MVINKILRTHFTYKLQLLQEYFIQSNFNL